MSAIRSILLSEILEQQARTAAVGPLRIGEHRVRAPRETVLQETVPVGLEVEVPGHQPRVVQDHDIVGGTGYVAYHMLHGKSVEKLPERGDINGAPACEPLLVDGHGKREYPGIRAYHGLQQRHEPRVGKVYVVKGVARGQDPDPGRTLHIFAVAQMSRHAEILQRMEDLVRLEGEARAEVPEAELHLRTLAAAIGNPRVDMYLLVYVLDIFRLGEGKPLQHAYALHIARVPEQHRPRAQAVAPGTPRLLKVRLGTLGQRHVHDEAHVGLVYAHSESVCAHHDPYAPLLPRVLAQRPLLRRQAGMIERGIHPFRREPCRKLLTALAAAQVHYPAPLHGIAYREQLPGLVLAAAHDVREVGPLEAALQNREAVAGSTGLRRSASILNPQAARGTRRAHRNGSTGRACQFVSDVAGHLRRRGRGKRYHGSVDQNTHGGDLQVVRTEVVAPLRDAVRLVDDYVAYLHHLQIGAEKARGQAFGRHIEELEVSVRGVVERRVNLPAVHS